MHIQTPADLARIVKTRRQSQGLTQQDIADAVGITRQSLARIERGNAGASFDLVLRIFDQLDIRLDAHSDFQPAAVVPFPTSNNGLPPIVQAATAGTRDIDATALLTQWQAAIERLSESLRATAAAGGSAPSEEEAG